LKNLKPENTFERKGKTKKISNKKRKTRQQVLRKT